MKPEINLVNWGVDRPGAEVEPVFDDSSRKSLVTKITRGWLLALVALMPIFFLPFTAPGDVLTISKQMLLYVFVFVGLMLWLAVAVRQGGVRLRTSGLEWGILAWLGAMLLSAIFSLQVLHSFTSANGFISLAALVLLFCLFLNFFEKENIDQIVNWFLAGSGLALLGGLLTIWGVPLSKWISFGSVNSLTAFGVLCFALAAATWFGAGVSSSAGKTRFWWLGVKIGVIIISALLLLIVNWWIYYAVLALAMLAIILSPGLLAKLSGQPARKANIIAPLAILVLAVLLAFGGQYFSFGFPGRAGLSPEVSLTQTSSYQIAGQVLKEKPAFGYGIGNYYLAFDKYKFKDINSTAFWNVRFNNGASELASLTVTTGGLGVLAWLALLFFVFKGAFSRRLYFIDDGSADQLWKVFPAFLAGVLLFVLYPISNPLLLFVFWLFLALVGLTLVNPEKNLNVPINNTSLPSVMVSLGFILTLVAGLAGGYLLLEKYTAEYYFAKASRTAITDQKSANEVVGLLVKAVNTNHSDPKYLNGISQILLSEISNDLNNTKDKKEDVVARIQTESQNAVQVSGLLATSYPNDSASWASSGYILQNLAMIIGGADNEAVARYKEALKRSPADPSLYLQIGSIYLNRADQTGIALADAKNKKQEIKNEADVTKQIADDYKNAEENLKKAVALKADYATALYNLGMVYERQNRLKDAIKQLELTRANDVGNAGLTFELGLLYYRDNQKEKAFAEMQNTVSIYKDYSNARWYMALMLEEVGRIDDAIAQLNEILKLDANKDNQVVKDKLASLEAGKREIPPAEVTSKKPLEAVQPKQK